jgi:hypothetical protein
MLVQHGYRGPLVHHFEPENKRQSMKYRHKSSPVRENFFTALSAGKFMLIALWDINGVAHSEFMSIGATIDSERCKNRTYLKSPS